MNAKEYVQYGEEWKNELMKLPKIQIIAFLRAARLEINEMESKSKEEAEERFKEAQSEFIRMGLTHEMDLEKIVRLAAFGKEGEG